MVNVLRAHVHQVELIPTMLQYHSRKKYYMQSFFSQQLISDYSYSRGGGAEFFNYSYSRGRCTELFSNSDYSRGRGTERP